VNPANRNQKRFTGRCPAEPDGSKKNKMGQLRNFVFCPAFLCFHRKHCTKNHIKPFKLLHRIIPHILVKMKSHFSMNSFVNSLRFSSMQTQSMYRHCRRHTFLSKSMVPSRSCNIQYVQKIVYPITLGSNFLANLASAHCCCQMLRLTNCRRLSRMRSKPTKDTTICVFNMQ